MCVCVYVYMCVCLCAFLCVFFHCLLVLYSHFGSFVFSISAVRTQFLAIEIARNREQLNSSLRFVTEASKDSGPQES